VAAALVGVVAVAGLFSVIGGDADQALNDSETVVAADEADSDAEEPLALEAAPSAEADAGDAAMALEESADDFAGASIAPPSDLVIDLGPIDLPGFNSELELVRIQVAEMTESSGVLQRMANGVDASCVGELPDPGSIRAIVTATVDGLDVEAYLDGEGGEFGYASMDCSVYDLP
jgi:hypothetical protein